MEEELAKFEKSLKDRVSAGFRYDAPGLSRDACDWAIERVKELLHSDREQLIRRIEEKYITEENRGGNSEQRIIYQRAWNIALDTAISIIKANDNDKE
jgi:hypothetical protein